MQSVCHVSKRRRDKALPMAGTPFLHGRVVFICTLLPAHDSVAAHMGRIVQWQRVAWQVYVLLR
jgi:hypothetical protein